LLDRIVLPRSPRRAGAAWIRVSAVPVVADLTLLGIWSFGGVVSNDYKLSMALRGLWLVGLGLVCLAVS